MRLICIPRWASARRCRALALLGGMAAVAGGRAGLAAQGASEPGDTLRQPPIVQNISRRPGIVEVEVTAAPASIPLLPGAAPAAVYAYNGTIPGPTIEVHEGDSVVIHFHNHLPEPTTVHWHGVHLPVDADGSPLYPIAPGGAHDYAFRVAQGSAGTYWYHPHPDARTTRQVALGLYGAIIVRPARDPLAGIPEKLLILSDNRLAPDGSVSFPDPASVQASVDMENGREGDRLFVNGQIMPRIVVPSGEVQRWRIVNASPARVYRLALTDQQLLHVGDDGGLFERPVEAADLVLANSERVEVLVRGQAPGSRSTLQDLPYDRYAPQTRPADWNSTHPLLALEYGAAGPLKAAPIPATLRVIPPVDTSHVFARRVIVLSQGLIDGKTMDMHRSDIRSRVGATEIWTIQNVVGMDHPFHLHGNHFQVLDRDGVAVPFRSWKDSVNVPRHSSLRLAVRFEDYPGKWMYHCHILDHEDEGMMAILELH